MLVPALPVCRSKNQQLFSGIHVRKSNCQLCRPANQQINTISLIHYACASSAGLPIKKSTAFFWHTCSKIELPALPVCQSTNQHKFSDTLLPVPALPVCLSTNQQLFSDIHVQKSNCQLCRPANQQIKIIS